MVITEGVLWFSALATLGFGLFVVLLKLQIWTARLLRRNKVTVVVYKYGKQQRHSFPTVRDAAANAIERIVNGEHVVHIEQRGKKLWDAFSKRNKNTLVKLARPKRYHASFLPYA